MFLERFLDRVPLPFIFGSEVGSVREVADSTDSVPRSCKEGVVIGRRGLRGGVRAGDCRASRGYRGILSGIGGGVN